MLNLATEVMSEHEINTISHLLLTWSINLYSSRPPLDSSSIKTHHSLSAIRQCRQNSFTKQEEWILQLPPLMQQQQ